MVPLNRIAYIATMVVARAHYYLFLRPICSRLRDAMSSLVVLALLVLWGKASAQNYVVVGPVVSLYKDNVYRSCCKPGAKSFGAEFEGLYSPAYGVYLEKRSPAGFVYSLEASKRVNNQAINIWNLPVRLPVPQINPWMTSAQLGYRFRQGKALTLGLFLGLTAELVKYNGYGLVDYHTIDDYLIHIGNFNGGHKLYLAARGDIAYALAKSWSVGLSVNAIGLLDSGRGWDFYFIDIVENSQRVFSRGWSIETYPVFFQIGLRWKFIE